MWGRVLDFEPLNFNLAYEQHDINKLPAGNAILYKLNLDTRQIVLFFINPAKTINTLIILILYTLTADFLYKIIL